MFMVGARSVRWWVSFAVLMSACGDDGGDGGSSGVGSGANRGGPDALAGYTWGMTQDVNGIEFDFGFEFGTSSVVATNTCTIGGDSLTAEVEAPVKYRYRATITQAAQAGDEACHVAVAPGTIDFEISGNTLTGVSQGQTLTFTSTGARSGLYGDWSYSSPDGFTITWSMGSGKLKVWGSCPGGQAPTLTVDADYDNFVEILEAKQDYVGDDAFNCQVAVDAGTFQYRFDGADLVLTMGGQETRFKAR